MPVDLKRAVQFARPLYKESRDSFTFPNCPTVAEAIIAACDEHAAEALEALHRIAVGHHDPVALARNVILSYQPHVRFPSRWPDDIPPGPPPAREK